MPDGFTVVLKGDAARDPVRGLMMIGIEGRGTDRILRQLNGLSSVRATHTTNGRWDVIVEIGTPTLEEFDAALPALLAALKPDDLLIITADHGNDPTWPGTDHTREDVPILLYGKAFSGGNFLGARETFADIGQTIADYFSLPPMANGTSLL